VAFEWFFVPGLPSENPEIIKVGCITYCANLQLKWGLNQSYSPRRELSNGVSHATCTQGNWVDSQLSVVGSQIANSTHDLSFDHNLCCKCPNGSCKPILDIYASIGFQWYKELLKAKGFDLCNHFLKFRESTGTPTPNMGVHLGVWEFILTLSHTPGSLSWPDLLQTLALVASPRLGLWHGWPKNDKVGKRLVGLC
jgi:hypothetical protein